VFNLVFIGHVRRLCIYVTLGFTCMSKKFKLVKFILSHLI